MRLLQSVLLFRDNAVRSLVLALRSLWLHKLRSMLSVLGIIIGTAAVIALMSFGEGSMQDALEAIARQGATNIIVTSVKPPDDASSQRRTFIAIYGLTYKDFDQFQMISSVVRSVPMRIFPQEIRRQQHMHHGRVVGTTAAYQEVNTLRLVQGRFLVNSDEVGPEGDDSQLRNVCVLGCDVAETLFPFESALGKSIVLNKHQYVVVGVLADRMPTASAGGTSSGEDFNSDIYIPLSTCRARFGEKIFLRQSGSRSGEQVELHQVTLTIRSMPEVRDAGDAVRFQLERNHFKKDWRVTVPLDKLEEAEQTKDRFLVLLFIIASISLAVGGIGIMNIMLATVTERTREIGIRRALGAKRRDIVLQFLIESIAQTTVGGLLGVATGLAVTFGLPRLVAYLIELGWLQTNLPSKLHVQSIFLSLAVSICVGVVFGLYPAWRASRLDPIEALRHE